MKKILLLLVCLGSLKAFSDVKISALPALAAGSATNTDVLPLVSGSTTYKFKLADIFSVATLNTNAFPVHGSVTNDNAAAGYVGEYISSSVTAFTNVTNSTTQWGDGANISLTAGDWDVTAQVAYSLNGAGTASAFGAGIGTTSGNNSPGNEGIDFLKTAVPTSSNNVGITVTKRASLSGTTVHYLKLLSTYGSGNPQYTGIIFARRRR